MLNCDCHNSRSTAWKSGDNNFVPRLRQKTSRCSLRLQTKNRVAIFIRVRFGYAGMCRCRKHTRRIDNCCLRAHNRVWPWAAWHIIFLIFDFGWIHSRSHTRRNDYHLQHTQKPSHIVYITYNRIGWHALHFSRFFFSSFPFDATLDVAIWLSCCNIATYHIKLLGPTGRNAVYAWAFYAKHLTYHSQGNSRAGKKPPSKRITFNLISLCLLFAEIWKNPRHHSAYVRVVT